MQLQMFGGSSTTVQNTSSYTPSAYELQLQKAQANYADAISPNSLWLNDTAKGLLQDSLGTVQVDYNNLNKNAQNQISNSQGMLSGLTTTNNSALASTNSTLSQLQNGQLPSAYLQNMSNAIKSGVTNTVGSNINDLGNRGVLNSSVTNKAMNDIENNVSNTMAQNYLNNINTVSGFANNQLSNTLNTTGANANIYNNQINNATAGTTAAAVAQEAAQQPAINLWNASLGLNGSTTSALAAAAGKGTSTSTQSTKTSGGLLNGLMQGVGAYYGAGGF